MGMTVGENGRVQKMERRVTGERSLMLRLLETLIPGWPPLLGWRSIGQTLRNRNYTLPQFGALT